MNEPQEELQQEPGDVLEMRFAYTPKARLDYFAVHAPETIPDWFTGPVLRYPVRPAHPEAPSPAYAKARDSLLDELTPHEVLEDHDDAVKEEAERCGLDEVRLRAHLAALRDYHDQVNDWREHCVRVDERNDRVRYFAWRRYYAEQMVGALTDDE